MTFGAARLPPLVFSHKHWLQKLRKFDKTHGLRSFPDEIRAALEYSEQECRYIYIYIIYIERQRARQTNRQAESEKKVSGGLNSLTYVRGSKVFRMYAMDRVVSRSTAPYIIPILDLWWTKWHWNFMFPPTYHSTNFHVHKHSSTPDSK
jgi:hypothetical protein